MDEKRFEEFERMLEVYLTGSTFTREQTGIIRAMVIPKLLVSERISKIEAKKSKLEKVLRELFNKKIQLMRDILKTEKKMVKFIK